MTTAEKKTLVIRYFEELWNKGNLDAADEIVACDFGSMRGSLPGREAVKLYISAYRASHPCTHFTVLSMIARGDLVIVCWVSRGTHRSLGTGDDPYLPVSGTSVYRIANDRIVEIWCEEQDSGPFQHSGVTPQLN